MAASAYARPATCLNSGRSRRAPRRAAGARRSPRGGYEEPKMTTSEQGGTTAPKPAPRPGPPRPGPRPGPTPAVHSAPVASAGDPHRFGRVDPDGTVWLISSAGERVIGSWQAGDAEELANNATQWKAAGDRLREILEEWRTISGLDRKTDDALWKRYSSAREAFNRRRGAHFAELDRERAGARQAKETLCERAEELSSSTEWGATSATFRDLLTEWKAVGRAAKDVDDALWQRFKGAQDTFFAARNAASSERDAEFRANADAKEALLAQAERVDTSDLEAARAALRAIGDKWDAIGKVPRERGAELERRLRAIEKKVRDTPTGGVDPEAQARADQFRARAEQYERQAEKAEAAGRAKDAEEARANAAQWRQWADAAAQALRG